MFSLEDKVAGWLNMVCAHYAESTHRVAMNHGVNRVFIAGGFCKHQIVQVYITKFWAMRNALFGQVILMISLEKEFLKSDARL